ncbi:MAG: low specificity L-threonine aldolase [Gammaproteobacteria bacterium]
MTKYGFLDDYSEGCHPRILEALGAANMRQQKAYGNDDYSEQAKALIREHLGLHDVPIYFVSGGSQANLIIIASALRSHEAVISAASGHIALWETGAIEATGHKIISVPTPDGKLTPDGVLEALAAHSQYPHVAKPRLVYVSNATEEGTLYSRAQLEALSATCKANDLLLMLDGARLGSAVSAPGGDLTLKDVAQLTDVFWIGGTKAGALIGEAIVIPNPQIAHEFPFHIKQRGALLAKGRVLGLQFLELFRDDLIFELCASANAMAQDISSAVVDAGYALNTPTESNQVFPVLPIQTIERLRERFDFHDWAAADDDHAVVRFVTSWATSASEVAALALAISRSPQVASEPKTQTGG